MLVYMAFVFFLPDYLGHTGQLHPDADPLVTPAHIVPEWYFLPFYAILRSIPDKLMGVLAMFGAIAVLALLPWLDTSRTRSGAYRPAFKQFFWLFVICCALLGWVGSKSPDDPIYESATVQTFESRAEADQAYEALVASEGADSVALTQHVDVEAHRAHWELKQTHFAFR